MSRIVITGASSGLGLAVFNMLTRDGHEVAGFSFPHHDVRDYEDCKNFMKEFCFYKDGQRNLDVLINCAGISPLSWIESATVEEWDQVLDTNCKGIFNMTKACLHYLSARAGFGRRHNVFGGGGGGTILNIVSTAAYTPMTCTHIYNASKAAAHMMTLQMARELKPRHDIDVFGIGPNQLADTGITNYVNATVPKLRGWTEEEAAAKQKAMAPAGEATPTSVLAEFISFLLQDKKHHKYLTGTVMQYGA